MINNKRQPGMTYYSTGKDNSLYFSSFHLTTATPAFCEKGPPPGLPP